MLLTQAVWLFVVLISLQIPESTACGQQLTVHPAQIHNTGLQQGKSSSNCEEQNTAEDFTAFKTITVSLW